MHFALEDEREVIFDHGRLFERDGPKTFHFVSEEGQNLDGVTRDRSGALWITTIFCCCTLDQRKGKDGNCRIPWVNGMRERESTKAERCSQEHR